MSQVRIRSPRAIIYGIIIIPTIFLLVIPLSIEPSIILYFEILEYVYGIDREISNPEFQANHWYQAIGQEGVWERTIFHSDYPLIVLFFLPVTIVPVAIKYYTGSLTKLAVIMTIVLVPIATALIIFIVLWICSLFTFCGFVSDLFIGF